MKEAGGLNHLDDAVSVGLNLVKEAVVNLLKED
jgi:hypothetical protein